MLLKLVVIAWFWTLVEVRSDIVLNVKLFYDSAFFSLNSGLQRKVEAKLNDLLAITNDLLSLDSLSQFQIRLKKTSLKPAHLIGEKWFASQSGLADVARHVDVNESAIHQNIFVTAHGLNQL